MFVLLGACTSSGDGTATSALHGDGAYRDATTDHAGAAHDAAVPQQSATVSVVMHGSGQFDLTKLDPKCALDPQGQFEALFHTTATFDDGSAYLATFASGSGQLTTASGCALPQISSLVLLDATVRAEIQATTESCRTYCAASARADAESQCGASASAAQCRDGAEATLSASCTTTCTTRAHSIVAESSLAAALFGSLDFEALHGADLGDLDVNLTFDHLEDANGNRL